MFHRGTSQPPFNALNATASSVLQFLEVSYLDKALQHPSHLEGMKPDVTLYIDAQPQMTMQKVLTPALHEYSCFTE